MKDGFIKVAAVNPPMTVGDCAYNVNLMMEAANKATNKGVKILVYPELALTGYTCGDLFLQDTLLSGAEEALMAFAEATKGIDMLNILGMPVKVFGKIYNAAVLVENGRILGVVPKVNIPNYGDLYEGRVFAAGNQTPILISLAGQETLFGANLLFVCRQIPELVVGVELGEDLWVANSPSIAHAMAGATVLCNPSASSELTTKAVYRKNLVAIQSAKLISAYVYADAGEGESTTDAVFSGHNLIAEKGAVLAESARFGNSMIVADIDVKRLMADRMRTSTYASAQLDEYAYVYFDLNVKKTNVTRVYSRTPFIPSNPVERDKRCEEILTMQAMGLKKRLAHARCESAVLGISGGLDSTLALLVTVKAFDMLELDRSKITAVTMPGFGTTDRTYLNAVELTKMLGATLKEISIVPAVKQHFVDINQPEDVRDVTYENSQARERTQILMDLANQCNGMVIGTGDMSELALGWATYNGDHMSMYGVNSAVPKTLVRHLVAYYAEHAEDKVKAILMDVLDTPVSPELLPPEEDGTIAQKTEDIVGPYELHDFYLYYMMRFGFSPTKIYRLACMAFRGQYDKATIKKWLSTFYWRFFSQQFKRSCVPDGPKVGTVALSPRGDLKMPSDASVAMWKKEIEELEV